MNFGILFEKVQDKDFPAGYFYAHVPSLGLTTHGLGIEGARQAAFDLARVWLAEISTVLIYKDLAPSGARNQKPLVQKNKTGLAKY